MDEKAVLASNFICNPEIVLREIDEDGALLFNIDINQVKVINDTALFIWQQCERKIDPSSLVTGI